MSGTVNSGIPMPIIASVEALDPYKVKVTWRDGARAGRTDVVDLSPLVTAFSFYRKLRNNQTLFDTVHVAQDGNAIAWLAGDELDMAATSIDRLAEEGSTRKVAAAGAR